MKSTALFAVWNEQEGDTRFFETLTQWEDYAKAGGTGNDYCVWSDRIYKVEMGQNIFEGDEVDHHDFRMNFEANARVCSNEQHAVVSDSEVVNEV